MPGTSPDKPGHDGKGENVDPRDIGAKQRFVALPGHDASGDQAAGAGAGVSGSIDER